MVTATGRWLVVVMAVVVACGAATLETQRPRLVALATDDNQAAPGYDKLGATWVPIAQRGRSLSRVTLTAEGDLWRAEVVQKLILEGPRDAQVQGWVDAYYAALKAQASAADASFPRPAQCLPCHEPVVKAWRGHAHARAVATLEKANRAVPECLACHDEQARRGAGRAADGGGVECASCHDKLSEHVADGRKTALLPCGRCHAPEHSPRFDEARYRALVRAVCGAR
ncbi:MAG: hypothetical protein HZB16_20905 [Armatimonadetes bacterium]|nr:hypothetical protein [Armatimonadota bacterium]